MIATELLNCELMRLALRAPFLPPRTSEFSKDGEGAGWKGAVICSRLATALPATFLECPAAFQCLFFQAWLEAFKEPRNDKRRNTCLMGVAVLVCPRMLFCPDSSLKQVPCIVLGAVMQTGKQCRTACLNLLC